MMTRTSLSAAPPAHRGDPCVAVRLKWRRHSCLRSFARLGIPRAADAPASRAAGIPGSPSCLIANLELEFDLTQRKLSPLRISNRKFSPILCFFTNHQSRVTSRRFLIHGGAIKTQRNPFKNSNLKNSNRRHTRAQVTQLLPAQAHPRRPLVRCLDSFRSSRQAFAAWGRNSDALSARN
jgi:hypothetical protein